MKSLISRLLISLRYRSTIVRYYLLCPFLRVFWGFPKVESLDETLDKLLKDKCSIARLGDGELDIIWGEYEGFQRADANLGRRLKEILNSNHPNVMIGVSDFYSENPNNRPSQKKFAKAFRIKNLIKIFRTFKRKDFYNPYISRPTSTYQNIDSKGVFDKLKRLWEGRNLYVVEGDKCRCGIGNDLFSNCKSVKRIICPSENAFDKYEEILATCKDLIPKGSIIYMALGATATCLAYDLGQEGYQALDLGHLDIEYEYMKRGFNGQKMIIPGKYVNEVQGGNQVDDSIVDKEYIRSIIATIK